MCMSRSVFTCHFNCICQILNIISKIEAFIYVAKVSFRTGLCILLALNYETSSTEVVLTEPESSTAARNRHLFSWFNYGLW